MRVRPAVMLEEHRVALARLHHRFDHAPMQHLPVGGLQRAKFFRPVRGEEGGIGMVARNLVLGNPGQPLARGIGEIALWRLRGVGAADQQRARGFIHLG